MGGTAAVCGGVNCPAHFAFFGVKFSPRRRITRRSEKGFKLRIGEGGVEIGDERANLAGMSSGALDALPVPVVLLLFKRPATTAQLLERLRAVRPSQILVVADGPRPDDAEEKEACARVRELVERGIDWPATVRTEYAETNLGLRRRVSSGLDWAFRQVDEAIILEDDCVPHADFFRFCAELLDYYRHDTRIGVIAGANFQPPSFSRPASYYFSKYPHCWGWATWKRAWRLFDLEAALWPALKADGLLTHMFADPLEAAYWEEIFEGVHAGRVNSWAYPWTLSCWGQSLLSIIPTVNLVTNVGDGEAATHCAGSPHLHRPAVATGFPLRHPANVLMDHAADDYCQRNVFGTAAPKGWRVKLRRLLDRAL